MNTSRQLPRTKKIYTNGLRTSIIQYDQKKKRIKRIKKIDSEFYIHLKKKLLGLLKFEQLKRDSLKIKKKIIINKKQKNVHHLNRFTKRDFEQLKKTLVKTPLIGLRRCIKIFRNGTLLQLHNYPDTMMIFSDSEVYSDFMKFMILEVNTILRHVLGIKKSEKIKRNLNEKRWKKVKQLFCVYFVALCRFLKKTSESNVQGFILRNISFFIPYLNDCKIQFTILIKLLCIFWIRGKPIVRNSAFFTITHFSLLFQNNFTLNFTLKQMYLHFVQRLKKKNNPIDQQIVNYLISTLVQIFGIDLIISYQHVFFSIQTLGIHLQNNLLLNERLERKLLLSNKNFAKQNEKINIFADWKIIHFLTFIIKVLSTYVKCTNSTLFPLVYPLVEILLGIIKLYSNMNFIPLRLKCIKFCIELIKRCQVHVPIVPKVIHIIQMLRVKKKYKKGDCTFDLRFSLTINEKEFHVKLHEFLVQKVCSVLMSYFNCYSMCVAFPELSLPIILLLKHEIKHNDYLSTKIRKPVMFLCKKVKEHACWIQNKRETLRIAPGDINDFLTFKDQAFLSPLGSYFRSPE